MKKAKPTSMLQGTLALFDRIKATINNCVNYPIRNLIKWQHGTCFEPRESKNELFGFGSLPISERHQAQDDSLALKERYRLHQFWDATSRENLKVNLYYLELLERALTLAAPELPDTLEAADIGCADWFYVQGLYALLRWWQHPRGRRVSLRGYEADAYRIQSDLHSRIDHALGHLAGLDQVRYIPSRFTPQPNTFHLITMLFPFVFLQDHLDWGLPVGRFRPRRLLAQAWQSLKKGGILIIVNQGKEEHLAQRDMLASLSIVPVVGFPNTSLFYQYEETRYVLVALKDTD